MSKLLLAKKMLGLTGKVFKRISEKEFYKNWKATGEMIKNSENEFIQTYRRIGGTGKFTALKSVKSAKKGVRLFKVKD